MDVVAFVKDDIVGRVDAVVCVGSDTERAVTVEEQFAFAVERTLLAAARAVDQRVRGSFSQNDEGSFAAKQVQCRRVGVSDAGTEEFYGILLLTKYRQRAVGCRAAYHIAYFLHRSVIRRDVTIVHCHFHSVLRL